MNGEPFQPLLEYFRERNFSLASEEIYARAVGQLIDFLSTRGHEFQELKLRPNFFNSFAHALKHGTVVGGFDPSGLWWVPRTSHNVSQLLAAAVEVSDWLVLRADATPLNPWRKASAAEQIAFWRRWNRATANSLLRHLRPAHAFEQQPLARRNASPALRIAKAEEPPPAFPEEHFSRLLFEGFARPGKGGSALLHVRQNVRDMMVALLMHGGGLRVSEPFHLFASDVFENPHDPSIAFVRVFHPSDGVIEFENAHGIPTKLNREAYLKLYHDRMPLDQAGKRTGWKNNLVNSNGLYMPVHWFPSAYGQLFLQLFRAYLEHCRPPSSLPWLFLTESGLPMTAKAYAHQYAAAIRRLGIRARKSDGTTPHGHRHAYGQRLSAAKQQGLIDEKIVQLCLHHRSVASQHVYTKDSIVDITRILERANQMIFETSQSRIGEEKFGATLTNGAAH
ncbi:MAG TPA: gamma-mobile-trio recombinase GmtY [Terrimicrobiaceae bacterium]